MYEDIICTIAENAEQVIQEATWGYGCADDVDELTELEELSRREKLRKHYGEGCFDDDTARKLEQRISKATFSCNKDDCSCFTAEAVSVRAYVRAGGCLPKPHWVRYCESLICDIRVESLKVTSLTSLCNLNLGVVVDMLNCDLAAQIYAVQKACDIRGEIVTKRQDCGLDFNISPEKVVCEIAQDVKITKKDCQILFDGFKSECGNKCDLDLGGFEAAIKKI